MYSFMASFEISCLFLLCHLNSLAPALSICQYVVPGIQANKAFVNVIYCRKCVFEEQYQVRVVIFQRPVTQQRNPTPKGLGWLTAPLPVTTVVRESRQVSPCAKRFTSECGYHIPGSNTPTNIVETPVPLRMECPLEFLGYVGTLNEYIT